MAKVYLGDVGTILKITTGYNFLTDSSATCELKVMRPGDSTAQTWGATISSTPSEAQSGIVRHIIDTTNLAGSGTYRIQSLVHAGDGTNQWYGNVASFIINPLWT